MKGFCVVCSSAVASVASCDKWCNESAEFLYSLGSLPLFMYYYFVNVLKTRRIFFFFLLLLFCCCCRRRGILGTGRPPSKVTTNPIVKKAPNSVVSSCPRVFWWWGREGNATQKGDVNFSSSSSYTVRPSVVVGKESCFAVVVNGKFSPPSLTPPSTYMNIKDSFDGLQIAVDDNQRLWRLRRRVAPTAAATFSGHNRTNCQYGKEENENTHHLAQIELEVSFFSMGPRVSVKILVKLASISPHPISHAVSFFKSIIKKNKDPKKEKKKRKTKKNPFFLGGEL